eukprot:1146402-Pelagomonas_calceolata.AAC.3
MSSTAIVTVVHSSSEWALLKQTPAAEQHLEEQQGISDSRALVQRVGTLKAEPATEEYPRRVQTGDS